MTKDEEEIVESGIAGGLVGLVLGEALFKNATAGALIGAAIAAAKKANESAKKTMYLFIERENGKLYAVNAKGEKKFIKDLKPGKKIPHILSSNSFMKQKRMRVFAGPNGSGKTTLINLVKDNKIALGIYVNADDIESALKGGQSISFEQYSLQPSTGDVQHFFGQSELSPQPHPNLDYGKKFTVENNRLIFSSSVVIDSYLAANIAELIRQQLLQAGISFTFETVMSHTSKIDFFKKALAQGYRVYFYYVATQDPDINVNRVVLRTLQQGHSVDEEKIRNRYYRSLQNLKAAVKQTTRAYIFDNTGNWPLQLAEITNGTDVQAFELEKSTEWFEKYLVDE